MTTSNNCITSFRYTFLHIAAPEFRSINLFFTIAIVIHMNTFAILIESLFLAQLTHYLQ